MGLACGRTWRRSSGSGPNDDVWEVWYLCTHRRVLHTHFEWCLYNSVWFVGNQRTVDVFSGDDEEDVLLIPIDDLL